MTLSRKKKIIQVVDIVPAKAGKAAKIPISVSHVVTEKNIPADERARTDRTSDSVRQLDPETVFGGRTHAQHEAFFAQSTKRPSLDEELSGSGFDGDDEMMSGNRRRMRRWVKMTLWVVGIAVAGYLFYGALYLLPRVDVTIVAKKINWEFHDALAINKNIQQVDTSTNQIPGQVVTFPSTSTENHVFSFVPTGNAYHEEKAQGTIIIVNTSNPAPQKLVATTRFQAPDGKIVRLVDDVVVPGVTGTGPATITAAVVADKAGPSYNIGPIDKLTIPGFAGTVKFDTYYGQIKSPLTGGFVGTGPYPTTDDIAKAKSQAEQQFQAMLAVALQNNLGSDFVVADGSMRLATTTERVDPTVGTDGKFSIFIEGSVQAMVFRAADVKRVLTSMASANLDDPSAYDATNETLTYRTAQVDWKKGMMTLPLDYTAVFVHHIDAGSIANGIAGKGEIDLKTYILGIRGVEKVTVVFWPFWVSSAPKNVDRIRVTVN